MNAFNWQTGRPSIFSLDKAFTGTKAGKTMSQVVSESVVSQTKRTGRNPGTIAGLSDYGDTLVVESANRRRRAAK